MNYTQILTISSLLLSSTCFAVEVALIKVFKSDGSILQLEKNGLYAHSAIKVKKGWLHAHPTRGVEIVKNFNDMGFAKVEVDIFVSSKIKNVPSSFLKKYLGLPYDRTFSWTDDSLYCSELVAKALKIKPTPMKFDSSIWNDNYTSSRGNLGLSPDDLVPLLKKRGFVAIKCVDIFLKANK